ERASHVGRPIDRVGGGRRHSGYRTIADEVIKDPVFAAEDARARTLAARHDFGRQVGRVGIPAAGRFVLHIRPSSFPGMRFPASLPVPSMWLCLESVPSI